MAKLGSGSHGPPHEVPVLPVFLLLFASVHAVSVMALEWDVGDHLVGAGENLLVAALGKIKGWEDFAKGVKWGFKTDKMVHKAQGLVEQLNPGPGGGTATLLDVVDTVTVIPPVSGSSSMVPVLTVDIAATISVRTGFCAAESATSQAVGVRSSIILSRHRGTQSLPPLAGTLRRCFPIRPGAPELAVLGLGRGGDLSLSFPTFSYLVTSDGSTVLSLPTTAAYQQQPPVGPGWSQGATVPLSINHSNPNDGRYYVEVAGIRVAGEVVVQTMPELALWPDGTGGVYLSTTDPYTYLESGVYGRLKAELMSQIERLNPGATSSSYVDNAGKLCYVRVGTGLMVPSMEILFAKSHAVMDLGVGNVWYREEPSTVCLAILPTKYPGGVSILGSWLQSGRAMTIDLTPAGGPGTLTFSAAAAGSPGTLMSSAAATGSPGTLTSSAAAASGTASCCWHAWLAVLGSLLIITKLD